MSTVPRQSPDDLLAYASAAFARGDLVSARAYATPAATLPQARHLLALVERRSGNRDAARTHFEAALAALPHEPAIHNNFANLLTEAGEPETALCHYRRAVELKPDYIDALANLGMLAKNLGYFEEARAALTRATELDPKSAKAWQLLGLLLKEVGELDTAASALERAVALAPADAKIAYARAHIEMECGGDSVALFDRALALDPDNLAPVLGKASALLATGHPREAIAMLAAHVAKRPDWLEGHLTLTQMRWQIGEGEASARSYDEALAKQPDNVHLFFAKIAALHRAQRYAEVLDAVRAARLRFGANPQISLGLDQFEAVASDEHGDTQRASELFDRLRQVPDANLRLARIRHLLRIRRPEMAAADAEAMAAESNARLAWAYLGAAWRLLGDPRWEWLEGDPRFIAAIDIEEIMPHLPAIAARLRQLHVLRVHPFDQSLRGGTQTDGHLLLRGEPEIVVLREALTRAVERYIAQLPPHDPKHPLLMEPRDRGFRFMGAWSVRLAAQGFHINHIHPAGWLSSAFYVALPDSLGDEGNPAGWLQLGQPSAELDLGLPPFRLMEPRPGRLALFPSYTWHGTVPFDDGERLTVAFDVGSRSR